MLLLRCNVQIPEEERVAGMDSSEWWSERGELPGILNWALRGLRSLRQAGRFIVPEDCQGEVDRLRTDANPARRFLEEHYETGSGKVATADVYSKYQVWCTTNGHHSLAEVGLGKEVARKFPTMKKGENDDGQQARECILRHTRAGLVAVLAVPVVLAIPSSFTRRALEPISLKELVRSRTTGTTRTQPPVSGLGRARRRNLDESRNF